MVRLCGAMCDGDGMWMWVCSGVCDGDVILVLL